MIIRYTLLFLVLFGAANALQSQFRHTPEENGEQNFFQIVNAANEYFGEEVELQSDNFKDKEYLRFKRWQWYWQSRVHADGSFPDLMTQKRTYDELQYPAAERDISSPWTNINQTFGDGGYNGMGRATSIAFHPTDPDIFYVGAPIGGIWKTTDGGQTYAALGDSLPYVSTGNICVDHQNPDNIYITVGDHNGWWNYGLGVFKSTDAGITWNTTSNNSEFTQNVAYLRMVMNPSNPLELFVAQTNGLMRTQDGGVTWQLVHEGSHNDVVFKPGNDSTLYCATDDYWGSSEVFKSVDHGETWQQISDFNESANYIELTVSPANFEYLGVQTSISGSVDFWASYDGGFFIDHISFMPDDGVIYTSPIDEDVIYCGFIVTYQSTNGGLTWEQITDWYNSGNYTEVHADNRFVSHNPLTNEIYFCNDGGIYRYRELNNQWTELTAGLIITQYYRIAVSQQSPIFMIGGTQDNGGRKRIAPGQWAATNGGDAMEVAINSEDDAVIYSTYIYGQLYRSYDQWDADVYQEITPPQAAQGAWVTPYILDPSNQSVIIAGYEDVYRSINDGDDWSALSSNLTGNSSNKISAIGVSAVDPDVIYAAYSNRFYYTLDGGDDWNNSIVFSGAGGLEISSICVHPTDPQKVWTTVSGYGDGKKVFYSEDAGDNFINITFNLPNVPCNASVIDSESEFLDLYVGTDVGVFVFDSVNQTWLYYGEGLPNTAISDLEIQYSSRKLRAGTFGRGIWENDLLSEVYIGQDEKIVEQNTTLRLTQNPVNDQLILNVHNKENQKGEFVILQSDGKEIKRISQNLPIGNYQIILDTSDLSVGTYLVRYAGKETNTGSLKFIRQ